MCVVVTLVVAASGCGPAGPELAEVEGRVLLDSRPVGDAVVTFSPQAPGGTTSAARTDAEGRFSLMYSRDLSGALLGTHHVTVVTTKLTDGDIAELKAQGLPLPAPYVAIPKRYREPGALSAEVKSGSNEFTFELTTK